MKKINENFRARLSRSDEGILALTQSVLQHILGLNEGTRSRIIKIIHNQGQWQDLKVSVRQLSGVAHRRLNDVINMAQDANPTTTPDNNEAEDEFNPDFGEYGTEFHGDPEPAFEPGPRDRMREDNKMSFAGYLLKEVTYDEEDLRDPQKKQEIMRMMRAGDEQAAQLVNRAERQQKQQNRANITQEQDPQRRQLLQKRQQLRQQMEKIDQQLEQGTQQQGKL